MTAVAAVPPGVTWFEPEPEFPLLLLPESSVLDDVLLPSSGATTLFPSSLESDEWEQAVSAAPPV